VAEHVTSEREFSDQVKSVAAIYNFDFVHFRPAQNRRGHWSTPVEGTLGKGFPDFLFIRRKDGRLLFRELKSETGKLSDDQAYVLVLLRMAGYDAEVWSPRDFSTGRIVREFSMSSDEWSATHRRENR
jgi:hypothetical protein